MKKETRMAELPNMKLDEIDNKILSILLENARISYTDLAKVIGISRVAVQNRVQSLINDNVIEKFTAVINPIKVGIEVSAFFDVGVEPEKLNEIAIKLAENPAVTSLYHMSGPSTLHMHGVFKNMTEMEDFLLNTLYATPGILRVDTEMLLKRYKSRMGMKI